MTGGSTGDAPSAEQAPHKAPVRIPLSARQIVFGAIILVVVIAAIAGFVQYRSGRARREYDALMLNTLDRLLTAQEGFFYDSLHYVGSLRALPTVRVAPGVHVELVNPDRRSWWGVATHTGLTGHRCVVWVGTAPASFPLDVRAPENEAKPLCFDDTKAGAQLNTHS
jgi:hypothetical protein